MSRSTSLGLSSSSVLAASVVCGKCSALWVIFTTVSARRRKGGELFCGRVEDLGGKNQSEDSRHGAHFPFGSSRPQRGLCTSRVRVEKGGAKRQGRRGRGRQGRAPGASANQNGLRQRPIIARLAWQICPAVRGGAARVPGPPVTLRRAFQESTGQGADKPGGGGWQAGPAWVLAQGHPREHP